jgi:hypothetical protein
VALFEHAYASKLVTKEAVSADSCIFCAGELLSLKSDEIGKPWPPDPNTGITRHWIRQTSRCGWWLTRRAWNSSSDWHGYYHQSALYGAAGCLKELDISSPDTATDEIRAYLMGRYESRRHIDAFRFEDVVASVYADLGYQAVVTNQRGDDGIDVFLRRGDETIGVQVKRCANVIDVDLIRELSGALVFHGITTGIFVTTSRFTSGGSRHVDRFKMRGQHIELVDADAFFGALEIAQAHHLERYNEMIIALAEKSTIVLHEYES